MIPSCGRKLSCPLLCPKEAKQSLKELFVNCPGKKGVEYKGGPFRPAIRTSPWKLRTWEVYVDAPSRKHNGPDRAPRKSIESSSLGWAKSRVERWKDGGKKVEK